jgi:DNA-binding YbaB/EbfC family protein
MPEPEDESPEYEDDDDDGDEDVDDGDEGFDLLGQMAQIQQQLMNAQQAAESQVVSGSAGGGAVTVVVSGAMEFQKVTIDPAVVATGEIDVLEDLILAALRDAVERANELNRQALGGLGLGGGLEGLFGG